MAFLAACIILFLKYKLFAWKVMETHITILYTERNTILLTGKMACWNKKSASPIRNVQNHVSQCFFSHCWVHALFSNNFKMWVFLYVFCMYFFSCVKSVRDVRDVNIFMHNRIPYFKQWRSQYSECRLWLGIIITR